jgi:hypothetical protein
MWSRREERERVRGALRAAIAEAARRRRAPVAAPAEPDAYGRTRSSASSPAGNSSAWRRSSPAIDTG